METTRSYRILDIGGGPEWNKTFGHGKEWLEDMRKLRAARLAREHPDNIYIVLDLHIPRAEAAFVQHELPNLHFMECNVLKSTHLPFVDGSIERVEMNHMWTPLTAIPTKKQNLDYKGILGASDYIQVLREVCRVITPGGILSITEKEDRLWNVRYLLSDTSDLDLDGMFMQELGLDGNIKTHHLIKVTDPDRSEYTKLALEAAANVYTLELRKKSGNPDALKSSQ